MDEARPSWRDRLKKLTASESAPVVAVVEKLAKKPSINMAALLRAVQQGAPCGVDRDGQVLNPSGDQRGTAGWLGSMFPRGSDK